MRDREALNLGVAIRRNIYFSSLSENENNIKTDDKELRIYYPVLGYGLASVVGLL